MSKALRYLPERNLARGWVRWHALWVEKKLAPSDVKADEEPVLDDKALGGAPEEATVEVEAQPSAVALATAWSRRHAAVKAKGTLGQLEMDKENVATTPGRTSHKRKGLSAA